MTQAEREAEELARTIAQADFIWGLGEQGVTACAPDLAGKMFDEAWADATSATRQKFLHIAQVVRASLSALEREPEIEKAAMAIAESMFDMTAPKGDGPFAVARLSANEMLLEKCRRAARAAAPFLAGGHTALTALESDPVRCPGCDEWRLRAFAAETEIKRLQAAFRVNALREGYTHAEVDAIILKSAEYGEKP